MTIKECILANNGVHPNRKTLITTVSLAVGVTRDAVGNMLRKLEKRGIVMAYTNGTAPAMPTSSPPRFGLNESELRQRYDIRFIIQTNAHKLERGMFIPEPDFVKQCNLPSNAGYKQFLDDPEFISYRGKAGSAVYWSHPDSIQKMKNDLVLR